jgi:catalase
MNFPTTDPVLFDAVFIPGGSESVRALSKQGNALHFINATYRHCKTIGALGEGIELLQASSIKEGSLARSDSSSILSELGVVIGGSHADRQAFYKDFRDSLVEYRHWQREEKDSKKVPS